MTRLTPTWLGSFYGAAFTFLEYEALTVQSIPHADRRNEAHLMRTKWYDYRRLHPLQATFFFVECYARAYGDHLKMAFEHKRRFQRGFKGKSFLESPEKLSFWRLRQVVDKLGIRYEFFMRHAMMWFFKRGWLHLPRPSHIANNDDLLADVVLAWETYCADSIQFPADNWYCVRHFVQHPDQLAFEASLVEQVKRKRNPQFALHTSLYTLDMLRIERAMMEFPEQAIYSAMQLKVA